MLQRTFGRHPLSVSALGLGAGEIGDGQIDDAHVGRLLNGALDAGITLIDTARGYGLSEDRIGRHLAHRRREFVLSTKVGYGVPEMPDWTYATIIAGVELACRTLRTDRIDIVHLHSCPVEVLWNNGVTDGLEECVRRGLVGVCAYSGENETLRSALESHRFGGLQFSVNLFDQRSLESVVPAAGADGMGIIAKRPLGNAPWRYEDRPVGQYCEEYWLRWKQMALRVGLPWDELALRFAAFAPGVHSCITGTTNLDHLRANAAVIEKGPLADDIIREVRTAFRRNDSDWRGQL